GPIAALTALAGFAVAFWTVTFGRIISHTIMLVPVAAMAAYSFWRARSAAGWPVNAWSVASGVWLGLSLNAYTAARSLPAVFAVFGVYVVIAHRSEWKRWLAHIGIVLMVASLVALPLVVYLAQNPAADDLSFFDIDRPLRELRGGDLQPVIETSLRTLGMFAFTSDPLPYYTVPGRPVFEPFGALLLAIGLWTVLRRWRTPPYAFVILWFCVSLVPGMFSQPAPNSTRTLGVQIVLFAIVGIAVDTLLRWVTATETRRHGEKHTVVSGSSRSRIAYAALGIVFAGNLIWTAHDYFTLWPSIDSVRFWHHSGVQAVAGRVQADPDTSPVVLCLPPFLIDENIPWWKPGWQHMRYLLHRPDVAVRYYDCAEALVFVDGPARYAFPDAAGVNALSPFPIYAEFLAAAGPTLDILPDRLGVIARVDRPPASLTRLLTDVTATPVVSWAPEAGGGAARLPVSFGGRAEFLGYTLHPSSFILHPLSTLELTTYWRVTADLPPQLALFTHVLSADGAIVTQQDRLALTSASLRPGDVFAQMHRLTLPADVPDGDYALSIGLYTYVDGKRLPIVEAGQPRGDRLWLRSITVRK
ncbi:MAG TPA: hypothetical protein VJ754_03265, partial [Anaerolineae bacterium]|nr:hypothetical protein [Anaerolineae bacterium]